jgi:hypothetical protein
MTSYQGVGEASDDVIASLRDMRGQVQALHDAVVDGLSGLSQDVMAVADKNGVECRYAGALAREFEEYRGANSRTKKLTHKNMAKRGAKYRGSVDKLLAFSDEEAVSD